MAMHQFDVETATEHGIEAAILIENIRFWLTKNKANGVNAKEGFWWTYNSAEAFHKLFPYIERRQICRVLTSLCTKGVLLKKKLNEANFDKTYWYTIPSEFMVENEVFKPEPLINSIGQNVQSNGQNDQRIGQNVQSNGQNDQRIGQNVHPIPDSKHTDSKHTDNKQQINKAVDKKPEFKKPRISEIQNYLTEQGLSVDANVFFDYYEANGWQIGKAKMKNWQATARNWHRRNQENKKTQQSAKPAGFDGYQPAKPTANPDF